MSSTNPIIENAYKKLKTKASLSGGVLRVAIGSATSPLYSTDLTDVTFKVDNQEFRAHKVVLALCSPVFKTMFFGSLADTVDCNAVSVPFSSELFGQLLVYVYCKDLQVETFSFAMEMWEVGDYYDMQDLRDLCKNVIDSKMNCQDAAALFLNPDLATRIGVYSKCESVLDNNVNTFFKTKDFLELGKEQVVKIIKRETLKVSEYGILEALLEWTAAKMKDNTAKEMQQESIIKPFLKYVHFEEMTVSELVNEVGRLGILSGEEKYSALAVASTREANYYITAANRIKYNGIEKPKALLRSNCYTRSSTHCPFGGFGNR